MEEISAKRLEIDILYGTNDQIKDQYERFKRKYPFARVIDIQPHLIPPTEKCELEFYSVFILWKDKIQVKEGGKVSK